MLVKSAFVAKNVRCKFTKNLVSRALLDFGIVDEGLWNCIISILWVIKPRFTKIKLPKFASLVEESGDEPCSQIPKSVFVLP